MLALTAPLAGPRFRGFPPPVAVRIPGSSVALVNARPAPDEPHGASRDGPSPGAGGAGEGARGGAAEAVPADVEAWLRGALREADETR